MQRGCGIIIAVALETSAGFFEREGGPADMFAWLRSRIESATPFPRIGVKRVADAPCNRSGVNIAVMDVPAIGPFGIPASGEGGHALLKRCACGSFYLEAAPAAASRPRLMRAVRTNRKFPRASANSTDCFASSRETWGFSRSACLGLFDPSRTLCA
jgi:hypothetical protein